MASSKEQEIAALRTNLKRCSPQTIEAAVRFRTTRDLSEIPTLVYGIVERHLPAENPRDLSQASDDTKLIEDLGIDSLTLLEIVLAIEETTGISVENEELREIATLGQVKEFIAQKIGTTSGGGQAAKPVKTRKYSAVDVLTRLPQQPPFLFVGESEIQGKTARSSYAIKGTEYFLEGHFLNNPVMPASLVFEALGQVACLWVLECLPEQLGIELGTNEVLFASMEEAHFYRRAVPGDRLDLEVELVSVHAPLAVFRGIAKRNGQKVAVVERLVLAFGVDVFEQLSKREHETEEGTMNQNNGTNGAGKTENAAAATLTGGGREVTDDLPVVLPTKAEDAPKGTVTRGDRARPDPEDPVNQGGDSAEKTASAGEEVDRNFGI